MASTAITFSIAGFWASRAVRYAPRKRHAPVTRTTLGRFGALLAEPPVSMGQSLSVGTPTGMAARRARPPVARGCGRHGLLSEFSALDPGTAEQLAVLLLGHALAPLLDD
jgi:hypothetical protein